MPAVNRHRSHPASARGFSLIELMVALVVGLILIGSVLTLTISNIQANSQNVASTRLNQELRALTGVITKDVQRARYQRDAIKVIGAGNPAPAALKTFQNITITDSVSATNDSDGVAATADGDCIQFAYQDASGPNGGAGADDGRAFWLAINNNVGAIYFASNNTPTAPPNCGSNGAIRLSSPEVNVTRLSFNYDNTTDSMVITVEGSLANDSTITRRNTEIVRIPTPAIP